MRSYQKKVFPDFNISLHSDVMEVHWYYRFKIENEYYLMPNVIQLSPVEGIEYYYNYSIPEIQEIVKRQNNNLTPIIAKSRYETQIGFNMDEKHKIFRDPNQQD